MGYRQGAERKGTEMNTPDKIISRMIAKAQQGMEFIDALESLIVEMQAEGAAMGWSKETQANIKIAVPAVLLGMYA